MFAYVAPLALVVVSNIFYHFCAKSVSSEIDPFASLTITYAVGAILSAALFFAFNRGGNLFQEYTNANWAPFVLGITIVGLEAGYLLSYQAGWPISTASIVQSSFLAVALLIVGYVVFKESITPTKLMGMAICLVGLFFINK